MARIKYIKPKPVKIVKRKKLTKKQWLFLWQRDKGVCKLCGSKIWVHDKPVDEHIKPLAQGGTNAMKNRALVHPACAKAKTNGKGGDNSATAKCKRIEKKHKGIKKPKWKPNSKDINEDLKGIKK